MYVVEHLLPDGLLFGCFRREGVAHAFVAAGGSQAAFDTDFVHQLRKVEAAADDTYAAHQAGRVGIDFVRRRGDVVAAGSTHVFGNDIQRDVFVFRFQTAHFFKGSIRDDGRTAGAVGTDNDAFDFAVGVGGFQSVAQHRHLVLITAADDAVQPDDGGMLVRLFVQRAAQTVSAGTGAAAAAAAVHGEQCAGKQHRADTAPNIAPQAAAALLLVYAHQQLVERVALPAFVFRRPGRRMEARLCLLLFFFALDFKAHK